MQSAILIDVPGIKKRAAIEESTLINASTAVPFPSNQFINVPPRYTLS
jgi:hypothetical protein